jgi:4-amino-4-deoxy-L-arabinose transferase-like glycosyltransferase
MSPAATPTRLVFAIGLAAWVANAVAIWLVAAPLGHDETQYAIAAKDLLAGAPERWFNLSRGATVVAIPGVLSGGSEIAMRLVPLLFGFGFVLAAWQVARRAFGDATAAWTVVALAVARSYMKFSAELLSDMPAATCLLAATAVILGELRPGPAGGASDPDDRPRWRAVLVAPLLAAALYLRYASCVPIAFLGVAWLVFGWRGIARRPAPIVATAALFLLLCVPHARSAIELTGSPLGIVLESSRAVPNKYVGEGLVAYLMLNPFVLYGWLMPPILIAGLASVLAAWRSGARRAVFLWLVAIASIVVIALITEAQVRYIFFGMTLLAILGVDAILRTIEHRLPRARRSIAAGAAAVIAVVWVFVMLGQLRHGARRTKGEGAASFVAAEAIRNDAAGRPCEVLGRHDPQLEWYSGCRAAQVVAYPAPGVWLYVVRDQTPGWQPELSGGPGRHTALLDRPGFVRVERVEPGR